MATINGTAGKDTIVGTTGDDIIDGLAGNDAINGGAGNDILYGNVGDDTLTGDFGNDTLYGGDGNDGMFGGGGNDVMYGEAGNDTMFGDANDDTMNGGAGVNKMDGGNGNDLFIVKAGEGTNTIVGNSGTDTLRIDFVPSDLTPAVRADLAAFSAWMQSNAANNTPAQLAAQTTAAPSFTLTSLNLTVSAVEVFTVTLNGQTVPLSQLLNSAPTAVQSVALATPEDHAISGQVVATDAQNDVLSYAVTQGPSHGALTLDAQTGAYVYTPGANYNGADTFSVKVADPLGAFTTQTVTVGVAAVNDAPGVAAVVALTTLEDKPVAGQVVATDVDGDTLGYTVAHGPANGVLALDAVTGAYTYTPGANFNGGDSFQVQVSDGHGGVTTQTVNVGVTPVNDAPVSADAVALTTAEDKPVAGQVVATDVDGDTLGYTVAHGPANGVLALDAVTGAYTYTPGANFNGGDSFQVQVSDGHGGVTTQTVNVGVTPVVDAPLLTTEDHSFTLPVALVAGTQNSDVIAANSGDSHVLGLAGNDTITIAGDKLVSVDLGIVAALGAFSASETLTLAISGVPADAVLSAGHREPDGTWILGHDEITGTFITATTLTNLTLHVTATATDANGESASLSRDMSITFDRDAGGGVVEGGAGDDQINGGDRSDIIYGSSVPLVAATLVAVAKVAPAVSKHTDNDVIHGGDGNDTIYGQSGADQLFGDGGNDYLSGGKGNDVLHGGAGINTVLGNSGDDTIVAGGGHDTVKGGTGFDTLDFSASDQGLAIDVSKGALSGFGDVTFSGIEKVIGSSFDDNYKGSSHDDMFVGGDGNDTIRGLGGSDVLTGGNGNDTFVYMKKDAGGVDHISDFAVGDRLDLHDFLKSAKYASIGDVVHVTDTAEGSLVSVKSGGSFVDLVILDGVHHTSAVDLASHSMILT